MLGASHHDVALPELANLAEVAPGLGIELAAQDSIDGAVILATCNRVEMYLHAGQFHPAMATVQGALAARSFSEEDLRGMVVRLEQDAVAHLFEVACGLDAMVVGEAEISGQVASALRAAQQDGTATATLQTLFQRAARTAKRVANGTDLGAAGRSAASVALDLALADKTPGPVLVVGTGAYARVIAHQLRDRDWTDLAVFSASGRAELFAQRHQARIAAASDLPYQLAKAELVVTCSGGGGVDEQIWHAGLAERAGPLTVVDLAMPPDLPAAIGAREDVRVVDLGQVAAHADPAATASVRAAHELIRDAVAEFQVERARRMLDPAVNALRAHIKAAADRELARLNLQGETAEQVETAMHRLTQQLLHHPTAQAKSLAKAGKATEYVRAVHLLFGIELDTPVGRDGEELPSWPTDCR